MNPAFIALGAANPGLIGLSSLDSTAGHSGSYKYGAQPKTDEPYEVFRTNRPTLVRDNPDGAERWEEIAGTSIGVVGLVFLLILGINMIGA